MTSDGQQQSETGKGDEWAISVHFNNGHHDRVATLELPRGRYTGTETLEDVVFPAMMDKLLEMKWQGFGLWAQHEAVHSTTTLDEINYMRKGSGEMVLDCEDHACHYRAVTVPVVQTSECVVCTVELNDANRHFPVCFHASVCRECEPKLSRCPTCRKPWRLGQV